MWTELELETPDGIITVGVEFTEHDASFDHAFGTEKRVEYEAVVTPLSYCDEDGDWLFTPAMLEWIGEHEHYNPPALQWVKDNEQMIINRALNKLNL
jgi:hypothetical protein